MTRVLKIFGSADEREKLAETYPTLASYDAFSLFEVSDQDARGLARKHLTEDITSQYHLPIGEPLGDTQQPRAAARATARAPRPPAKTKSPGPGRHHYIVQFVGPIKRSWLTQVKKAGGEVRAPYQGFAYVVRADKNGVAAIKALPMV